MKTVTLEQDETTFHFNTTHTWEGLEVMEVNPPEKINGCSVLWKGSGHYRIFINSALPEKDKAKTFVHEMLHLYRKDHEKKGADIDKIELECHGLTDEIIELLDI